MGHSSYHYSTGLFRLDNLQSIDVLLVWIGLIHRLASELSEFLFCHDYNTVTRCPGIVVVVLWLGQEGHLASKSLHQLPLIETTFPPLLFLHHWPFSFSCLRRTWWVGWCETGKGESRGQLANPGSRGKMEACVSLLLCRVSQPLTTHNAT